MLMQRISTVKRYYRRLASNSVTLGIHTDFAG